MARSKEQKQQLVEDYKEKIKGAKALFVIEPKGLSANESVEIKKALYDLDSSFNVVKNSLFKIALTESEFEVRDEITTNQKAIIFSGEQISESAKVIKEFLSKKENKDKMEFVLGYLDGKLIEGSQIRELADLPSKDVMLAQVLATMKAPISGFVNVLAGNTRNLVNVLNAIKEQKEN